MVHGVVSALFYTHTQVHTRIICNRCTLPREHITFTTALRLWPFRRVRHTQGRVHTFTAVHVRHPSPRHFRLVLPQLWLSRGRWCRVGRTVKVCAHARPVLVVRRAHGMAWTARASGAFAVRGRWSKRITGFGQHVRRGTHYQQADEHFRETR